MKKTLKMITVIAIASAALFMGLAHALEAPTDPMAKTFYVAPAPQDGATVLSAKASHSVPDLNQGAVAGNTKMDGADVVADLQFPLEDYATDLARLIQKGLNKQGHGGGSGGIRQQSLGQNGGGSSCITGCIPIT